MGNSKVTRAYEAVKKAAHSDTPLKRIVADVKKHRELHSLSHHEVNSLGLRNGMSEEAIQERVDKAFPPV